MPKVSILIPTYKPDYLDLCIASALAQSYRDFELLIGDDSVGDDVKNVVTRWSDTRIWYGRNPNSEGPLGSNRAFLTDKAQGDYIKYLWHDDFLYPDSLDLLVSVAMASNAAVAFHGRQFVDGAGRTIGTGSVLPAGQIVALVPQNIFELMVRNRFNFIGEPSNILVSAALLKERPETFGFLDGRRLRFLADVALYVNLAAAGEKIVGCGHVGSAFRMHAGQNSSQDSPYYSAGLFEWELFNRWAVDRGFLPREGSSEVIREIHQGYHQHVDRFPELSRFLQGGSDAGEGPLLTSGFMAALEAGWSDIDRRGSAGRTRRSESPTEVRQGLKVAG